jgi:ABC-2 type transport system ATP-binding protein
MAGSEQPSVRVTALRKTFTVPVRQPGLKASLAALFKRETRQVTAVNEMNFEIAAGEVVGFLGPNGAGKTTSLKMLAGLLHPTSGSAEVLGFTPWQRQPAYLRQMTLIMGNRNQLQWDLPVLDSFELTQAIYRIPRRQFLETRDHMIELLELGGLVDKPVRNLSLGERMKAEIAGALLHLPAVLFLDEPTIGLDITMQKRIRTFIADYNRKHGATVLLTSHYMADVQALCKRVIVIDHGNVLFDGDLHQLTTDFGSTKTIVARLDVDDAAALAAYGSSAVDRGDGTWSFRVDRSAVAEVTGRLLAEQQVVDLTIEDPPIEDVIERVFAQHAPDQ